MPQKIYRDLSQTPPEPPAPDKSSRGVRIAQWAFIILALTAIGWMIFNQPQARSLVCDGTYDGKLTSFGSCHFE